MLRPRARVKEENRMTASEPSPRDTLLRRERTADGFERLYAEAGFGLANIIRTGSPFHIIEGAPV